jgi:site-specific DNA-methyltransferase (adenine-specific)
VKPYYEADGITIYHGDCRDIAEPWALADIIDTDPPYSLSVATDHTNRPGKGTRRLNFFAGDQDWDVMTALVLETVDLASHSERVRSFYMWCGHRQFGPVIDRLEKLGWQTRFLVWNKKCPVPAPPGVGWNSGAELCVYAFRSGRLWNWETGKEPRSNVITADSYRHGQPGKVAHPTQKPVVLMRLPILSSCPEGGTVLDPFMGSGTTLVAAREAGRRAIGIELEEEYCEIAARRLDQQALDLGGAA